MTQLMLSASGLLGFGNLVNRQQMPNLITKESADLFPLDDSFCKLLYNSRNETKYIALINSHLNK